MKKSDTFSIQCRLQNNNRFMVTWIPEKFAIKGKYLKLKDRRTGQWENGWLVVETGIRMDYSVIVERSEDYKKMKEVTDI